METEISYMDAVSFRSICTWSRFEKWLNIVSAAYGTEDILCRGGWGDLL